MNQKPIKTQRSKRLSSMSTRASTRPSIDITISPPNPQSELNEKIIEVEEEQQKQEQNQESVIQIPQIFVHKDQESNNNKLDENKDPEPQKQLPAVDFYKDAPSDIMKFIKQAKKFKKNTKIFRYIGGFFLVAFTVGIIIALASQKFILAAQYVMQCLSFMLFTVSCNEGFKAIQFILMKDELKESYLNGKYSINFDITAIMLMILSAIGKEREWTNIIVSLIVIPLFMAYKYSRFVNVSKLLKQEFISIFEKYPIEHEHSIRSYLVHMNNEKD